MQKIIPFLWFESDMDAIVSYYSSLFPGVASGERSEITNTPSGTIQNQSITIYDTQFDLMTAGPYQPFNPTVSFIIHCDTTNEAHELWDKITSNGTALMPLAAYDFAPLFGWATDKYGVSWQVLYMPDTRPAAKITSTLMFCGDVCGRARGAMEFYTSIFPNSSTSYLSEYTPEDIEVDDKRAQTKHAGFVLDGMQFSVLDSGKKSPLTFDQAISFVVNCADQAELDYYWEKLSLNGKTIQCGWLNDQFGVPWQIVPTRMTEMLTTGTPEQISRVTEAFMQMIKFDIAKLEEAFNNES